MIPALLLGLGLQVYRTIPPEHIAGLASGTLKLCGGVIRNAAGQNGAGQIVGHLSSGNASDLLGLLPSAELIGSIAANGQIINIGSQLKHVTSIATAGAALSGLGVVIGIAGFAYMQHRLSSIETKIAAIGKDVKAIRQHLENAMTSRLRPAVENLRLAEMATDQNLRNGLLQDARQEFSALASQWAQEWPMTIELQKIELIDELYLTAILGKAAACSNLGFHQEAASDLANNALVWDKQAREHVRVQLFGQNIECFLDDGDTDLLSTQNLIELLDFAHRTQLGLNWIDELRKIRSGSSLLRRFGNYSIPSSAIPFARRLSARSDHLDATVAHFNYLERKKISSADFKIALEKAN